MATSITRTGREVKRQETVLRPASRRNRGDSSDPAFATFFREGSWLREPPTLAPENEHIACVGRKQKERREWVAERLIRIQRRKWPPVFPAYVDLVRDAVREFSMAPCCQDRQCALTRAVLAIRQLTWMEGAVAGIDESGHVYLIPQRTREGRDIGIVPIQSVIRGTRTGI